MESQGCLDSPKGPWDWEGAVEAGLAKQFDELEVREDLAAKDSKKICGMIDS